MSHRVLELIEEAAAELERAGYLLVEREGTGGRRDSKVRADLLAYGPNRNNEVAPVALVEIKSGPSAVAAAKLAQLASYSNLFGTEHNYVFDGTWLKAASDFTRLIQVPGPEPAREINSLTQTPPQTFYMWLAQDLRLHKQRNPEYSWLTLLGDILAGKRASDSPEVALWRSAGTSAFWSIGQLVEERQPSVAGEFFVPRNIALALSRLLDPRDQAGIIDPFCGLGAVLWASRELASEDDRRVALQGWDRRPDAVEAAGAFASLIGAQDAVFRVGDWLVDDGTDRRCDYLVGVPPMGLRLREAVPLPWGAETTDGDVALLAQSADNLQPGGRAVLLMSRKILSARGSALRLREWLMKHRRIVALIGLPPGALTSTGIPTVIVVVEHAHPAETLVAELQNDWVRQLGASGAFMGTYRTHVT